jgi:flagellar protein FliS
MPNARTAYMDASVQTASPARLLVMLYDRLVLDCRRALEAQQAGDHAAAHRHLVHAQDVVVELRSSLRVDDWEGGPSLDALYGHLHVRLVAANIRRDAELTQHCLTIVEGLAEAWREAALEPTAVGS